MDRFILACQLRASRMKSAIDRRIKDARFPEVNTIDGFDFDFDPPCKKLRARYLALHDLSFLAKGINPLFLGIPGTGDARSELRAPRTGDRGALRSRRCGT